MPSGERIRIAFTCGVGGLVGCVVEWREGGRAEGGRSYGEEGEVWCHFWGDDLGIVRCLVVGELDIVGG